MKFDWLSRLLNRKPRYRFTEHIDPPAISFARSAYDGLIECLAPSCSARHEGVALLLGRADGAKVSVLQTVRPKAKTGAGHFVIEARAMANVVALAMELDLQIVGQVHTHPYEAFHSAGDEEGANIRYDGFISIVIPDYGDHLPSLSGWAVYRFDESDGWQPQSVEILKVVDGFAVL